MTTGGAVRFVGATVLALLTSALSAALLWIPAALLIGAGAWLVGSDDPRQTAIGGASFFALLWWLGEFFGKLSLLIRQVREAAQRERIARALDEGQESPP